MGCKSSKSVQTEEFSRPPPLQTPSPTPLPSRSDSVKPRRASQNGAPNLHINLSAPIHGVESPAIPSPAPPTSATLRKMDPRALPELSSATVLASALNDSAYFANLLASICVKARIGSSDPDLATYHRLVEGLAFARDDKLCHGDDVIEIAAAAGSADVLELLLTASPPLAKHVKPATGNTLLHYAAMGPRHIHGIYDVLREHILHDTEVQNAPGTPMCSTPGPGGLAEPSSKNHNGEPTPGGSMQKGAAAVAKKKSTGLQYVQKLLLLSRVDNPEDGTISLPRADSGSFFASSTSITSYTNANGAAGNASNGHAPAAALPAVPHPIAFVRERSDFSSTNLAALAAHNRLKGRASHFAPGDVRMTSPTDQNAKPPISPPSQPVGAADQSSTQTTTAGQQPSDTQTSPGRSTPEQKTEAEGSAASNQTVDVTNNAAPLPAANAGNESVCSTTADTVPSETSPDTRLTDKSQNTPSVLSPQAASVCASPSIVTETPPVTVALPLHDLVKRFPPRNMERTVQVLLQHGCDKNKKNLFGKVAYHIAAAQASQIVPDATVCVSSSGYGASLLSDGSLFERLLHNVAVDWDAVSAKLYDATTMPKVAFYGGTPRAL